MSTDEPDPVDLGTLCDNQVFSFPAPDLILYQNCKDCAFIFPDLLIQMFMSPSLASIPFLWATVARQPIALKTKKRKQPNSHAIFSLPTRPESNSDPFVVRRHHHRRRRLADDRLHVLRGIGHVRHVLHALHVRPWRPVPCLVAGQRSRIVVPRAFRSSRQGC